MLQKLWQQTQGKSGKRRGRWAPLALKALGFLGNLCLSKTEEVSQLLKAGTKFKPDITWSLEHSSVIWG